MTATALENAPERYIGKYRVIRELGKGDMGTVFLGHDPLIDREVAIKLAHEDRLACAENGELYKRMFFNGAQTGGTLRHPNIVAIFEAGVQGALPYIAMEYAPGGRTLDRFCHIEHLLPIRDVVTIVYKCAMALDYAHKKGVVHRDIKPRNILITAQKDVKISGFGIALVPEQAGKTAPTGSPLYMSPEQIRQETLNGQTDLFSLGTVMYEALTGKHPFAAENIASVSQRILSHSAPPLWEHRSDVPEILQRIVTRALAKKVSQRYKTGLDFAGDLSLVFDFLQTTADESCRQARFAAVRNLAFFRTFTDAELWDLVDASAWQQTRAGEPIPQASNHDNTLHIVLSGSVRSDGRHETEQLNPGDCYGEMGFITGKPQTMRLRALSDTTIMSVPAAVVERAPVNLQLRFHKRLLHCVIERLARVTNQSVLNTAVSR